MKEKRGDCMPISEVIYQKRKHLGLTQEQIANRLNVSIPAVSKWESGSSYPDITILPALARLLKTDLNTLLCYEQELSEREVGEFLNQLSETIWNESFPVAFQMATLKMKEYPTDAKLIYSIAMVLQGALYMVDLLPDESQYYDKEIEHLYELVGQSDHAQYKNQANYMLASRAINDEDYTKAQEILDRLPEYHGLDKGMLQAKLWVEEGKYNDAAQLYEQKMISNVNELQAPLFQLIRIAVEEGNIEQAQELVHCGETITELFGFWKYNFYVYRFEKATAEKNAEEVIAVLKPMLEALFVPWNMKESPIARHLDENTQNSDLGQRILSSILSDLENNPNYAFLKGQHEFEEILKQYKENR